MNKRIFVVGFPRSGTTLVQSILNETNQVCAFPETHFFSRLLSQRFLLNKVGLTSPRVILQMLKLAKLPIFSDCQHIQLKWRFGLRAQSDAFINYLDLVASDLGYSIWSEKTPNHINFVDYLDRHIDGAYFIYVVRHPFNAIASLLTVSRQYPEIWGVKELEGCCLRWNIESAIALKSAHKQKHSIVIYDQLVEHKESRKSLFNFLEIEPSNMSAKPAKVHNIINDDEPWKKNNLEKLFINDKEKYLQVLTSDEISLMKRLVDMNIWEKLNVLQAMHNE